MLGGSGRRISAAGRAKGLLFAWKHHLCSCNTKNNKTGVFAAFSGAPQAALKTVTRQTKMCLYRLSKTISALFFITSELH